VQISRVGDPGGELGLAHHSVLPTPLTHPVVEVKFHPDGVRDDQDGVPQRQRRPSALSPDAAAARLRAHHHPFDSPTSVTSPPPNTART